METKSRMKTEVFLDTAFALALAVPKDLHHARAMLLADELENLNARMVTTRSVILEIGDALSKKQYRQAAIDLLSALEADPAIEIIPLTEDLYRRAYQLYSNRDDKEWGLTDCVSFIVMEDRNLTEALTTDEHFKQAGFKALLLEHS
jgi:uncharacterized protein